MDAQMRQRFTMALTGAAAGLSFYGLAHALDSDILSGKAALGLTAGALTFFTALLGIAGPLTLKRAALSALLVALGVAGLLLLASQRFEAPTDLFDSPIPILAALVLVFVPLPFLVAAQRSSWRDYRLLFTEAWTIVVRYAAAWLFVGVVWLVILLSDLLLSMVGLEPVGNLITSAPLAWVITGAVLGLGIAVVDELPDVVSPYLVLRLLRLLLPAVLIVVLLFLLVLPVQGLSGVFSSLSAAVTLLTIAAMAATLVTAALDQSPAEQSRSTVILRSAQMLALLVIAPAVLGAWAVWLRVAEYGWTPDRVFAAVVAVLGLGYGLVYGAAVLRGRGWERRIRQGNIWMALALMGAAALLLTPVLDPLRIAARSQITRFETGKIPADQLDLDAFAEWGKAGEAVLARLEAIAKDPGQKPLADRLAMRGQPEATPVSTNQLADLAALIPLRPRTATAVRDEILATLWPQEVETWLDHCRRKMPDGAPGCVMLVADLWPWRAGQEAVVILRDEVDLLEAEGFVQGEAGLTRVSVSELAASLPQGKAAIAWMQAAQAADPPQLEPVEMKALRVQGVDLALHP
ncbi:protein of unknown function [Gemmobacter aquatilis]|uniref:DUF4153 domain-containing protein n=1 Tax=Gemmobacter aquatilis TaxID=933059 RepID=A0A1H8HVU5_9RHOB|nr:DUF4153 domain-containing protein [Gemmobacter aquatilis]SEN60134.1 protein of unknown function [Gemmobacter aquatilis]